MSGKHAPFGPEADHKTQERRIRRYLARIDPKRLGLHGKISIDKITSLPSTGEQHINYLLALNAKFFILRLSVRHSKFQYEHLSNEYRVLRVLERYGVAPKAYLLSKKSVVGEPFIIIEYLEGTPLKHLTPERVRELARIVAKIHKIKISRVQRKHIRERNSKEKLFEPIKWFRRHAHAYLGGSKRREAFASEISGAYNRSYSSAIKFRSRSRLLHLDIALEHLILKGGELRIIDWERASLGDPYYELAALFDRIRMSSHDQNLFFDEYCKQTNYCDSKRLSFFSKVRALDRLFWAIYEAREIKGGLKERNFPKSKTWKIYAEVAERQFNCLKKYGLIAHDARCLEREDW